MQKSNTSRNTKLLQVYITPKLHKALQQYCLDKEIKNAPVVRDILATFLAEEGYFERGEN